MLQFRYKDLNIEVFSDLDHSVGSADNVNKYEKYFVSDEVEYNTAQHAVRITKDGNEINSCLTIGGGGATGIHKHSAILDDNTLLICCSNYLYCLSIPGLDLVWKTKADDITCFQVYKLEDDYITHGEIDVCRVTKGGEIKWKTSGRDIFVSLDGQNEFQLKDDHIILTDFIGNIYKVNFNGESEVIKDVG